MRWPHRPARTLIVASCHIVALALLIPSAWPVQGHWGRTARAAVVYLWFALLTLVLLGIESHRPKRPWMVERFLLVAVALPLLIVSGCVAFFYWVWLLPT